MDASVCQWPTSLHLPQRRLSSGLRYAMVDALDVEFGGEQILSQALMLIAIEC
jgi:hypothetical protein